MSIETVVAPPAELARVFAERLASSARSVQADGRALSLVLPGGSVAEVFFPVLSRSPIDWAQVNLFWGDERAVPLDGPESNFRLADELLLRRIALNRARVHPMPADAADLDAAARSYETELDRVLGDPPRFDIVLLGVGPDGHVCSLFPGHAALSETSRRVLAIPDSPKPPPRRLTLTLPALEGAEIYIAAFGAAKAEVMREALFTPGSLLPVARAARAGRRAVFLSDDESIRPLID
jgi:6-phosphogluconolactonase